MKLEKKTKSNFYLVECLGGLGISKVRIVRAQSQQECTKICLESTNCMTSFYNSHIKTCQILGNL